MLPSVVLRPPLTDGGTSFVRHTREQIIPPKDTLAGEQGSSWLVCVFTSSSAREADYTPECVVETLPSLPFLLLWPCNTCYSERHFLRLPGPMNHGRHFFAQPFGRRATVFLTSVLNQSRLHRNQSKPSGSRVRAEK